MLERLGRRLLLVAVAAVCGCAQGGPAFQEYQAAFDAQYAQGTRVFDRLGQAELALGGGGARDAGVTSFDPDLAGVYLGIGDPPLTGAIRGSLTSVRDYNTTLGAMVSGESARQLSARMGAAAASAAGTAGALGAAGGFGGGGVAAAAAAVAALLPIFRQLAAIEDRAEFRVQFLAAYPDVRALMLALRSGTPEMFEVIRASYVVPGDFAGVDGVPRASLPRLEQDRRLLAGWVILLDQTIVAMDAAVAAAAQGGLGTDTAALSAAAFDLRVLAEAVQAVRF